jgi:hypothetical protein
MVAKLPQSRRRRNDNQLRFCIGMVKIGCGPAQGSGQKQRFPAAMRIAARHGIPSGVERGSADPRGVGHLVPIGGIVLSILIHNLQRGGVGIPLIAQQQHM